MKIILSNNTSFEILYETITIEEFLLLADKLKELAITSRGLEQGNFVISNTTQTQSQPVQEQEQEQEQEVAQVNLSEIPIEERILKLKNEGNELSQIAKAFDITTSQARTLYIRAYQKERYQRLKGKKGGYKKEERKKASSRSRWTGRDEVLEALKAHYFGTKEDKQEIAKRKSKSWEDILKSFWALTKRYNIKPSDLGLSKWGKPKGVTLELPKGVTYDKEEKSQETKTEIETETTIDMAEQQFIDFFANYVKKGGFEDELKEAVLLLQKWLKSQGRPGDVQDVTNFLGNKVKTLRPIIPTNTLEEWLK